MHRISLHQDVNYCYFNKNSSLHLNNYEENVLKKVFESNFMNCVNIWMFIHTYIFFITKCVKIVKINQKYSWSSYRNIYFPLVQWFWNLNTIWFYHQGMTTILIYLIYVRVRNFLQGLFCKTVFILNTSSPGEPLPLFFCYPFVSVINFII